MVQFSVILEHLRKYRPDWAVDVVVGRGKHTALTGRCRRVYHDQEGGPPGGYDTEADLGWYENYCRYEGRPNSKITNCLQEVFGIDYDHSLGRYRIDVHNEAQAKARKYLTSIGCTHTASGKLNAVVVHYAGNTSPDRKNLAHWQASGIFDLVQKAGRVPVLLDWDRRSSLADGKRIFCPSPQSNGDIWGGFGSGDAEVLAALIGWAEAFIGIDSGPGKVASATETPSLICWIRHHPLQFHDPAPNTTHLVPHDHRRLPPIEGSGSLGEWFEKNYRWETYTGDHGLVSAARNWLARTLGCEEPQVEDKPFVTPQGIGDVIWALFKAKPLRSGKPVDIILAGDPGQEVCKRAIPFVQRFGFVRDVSVLDIPHLEDKEERADSRGRYRYVADGERGGFHYLMPNRALEDGKRLEEWLPEVPLDWSVLDDFSWKDTERGDEIGKSLGNFVAFYLGPESGNVDEGHNRGFLWEPRDWNALGLLLSKLGLQIVVVGAGYDRSYWERYVRTGSQEMGMHWLDLIGRLEIGETFALLKRAKAFVSYQCGLAIFAHYLGVPVATWWRRDGDSCHPKYLVSFDNRMKDGWTKPDVVAAGKYLGLLYGEMTAADLAYEMEKRGWLT